nr:MAG TPA: hypothetical protein [Caudoviricetes sp.]
MICKITIFSSNSLIYYQISPMSPNFLRNVYSLYNRFMI